MLSRNSIYAISVGVGIVLAASAFVFFAPNNKLVTTTPVPNDALRADWKVVTTGDPKFSISFPDTATHETQNLTSPDGKMAIVRDTYMAQADPRAVYFLQMLKYSVSLENNTEDALRILIDGMVKTDANNELISVKPIAVAGLRGMDFEIKDTKRDISYRGRVLVKAKILYQLYSAYETEQFSQTDFDYFLNSFTVR